MCTGRKSWTAGCGATSLSQLMHDALGFASDLFIAWHSLNPPSSGVGRRLQLGAMLLDDLSELNPTTLLGDGTP